MGTEFNAKIDAMEGLNAEEKKAFKEQNQQVVTEHFIPAYKALLEGLEALKGTGTNAEGICQVSGRKALLSVSGGFLHRANLSNYGRSSESD